MRTAFTILLVLLMLLAISSGVTKIALMQQDVDLFVKHGFSNPILVAFGTIQVIGGLLLLPKQTRFYGAAIVAITFLVSLAVLLMEGDVPVSIATAVATLLLGIVMKQSWNSVSSES